MKQADFSKPFIPVSYGLLILEVANTYGVDSQRLLAEAGIEESLLDEPDARLSAFQASRLLYLATQRSKEPGFGYALGLHSSLTSHGIMGYGLISSSSIGAAIALGEKFVQLRLPMLAIRQFIDRDWAVIEVTETAPLEPMRQCFLDLFLVGLARIAPALMSGSLPLNEIELCFDYSQPDYYPRFADRLPKVRFDHDAVQLRFPAKYLAFRPDTANSVTKRMVEEQCARELEKLGLAGDLVQHVQALLAAKTEGYPDLHAVAEHLHMSPRSLKRKLAELDTSFRKLLGASRHQDSIRLLKNSDMTIERIAAQLGYADPANFTRAFRKWSGVTPSGYRQLKR